MFDPRHSPADPPRTAADGVAFLEDRFHRWHGHIAAPDDDAMCTPPEPRGAYFSAEPIDGRDIPYNPSDRDSPALDD
ncbi:hypothetical protein GCM10010399_47000 [Dactylosporangium fulvum]|uniref:Uncharacterized protein n=1 Tax=Dactylosporangium fulvum TaxID=53359 RepID=A0ABY5VM86_9ACTN|nr:hypothetical protein [Dactylosporangium fulvum]UWP78683.1 hypothetical protein Dfulv_26280 [Dactylosporangium fulvum]